jgi:hypothetical protein
VSQIEISSRESFLAEVVVRTSYRRSQLRAPAAAAKTLFRMRWRVLRIKILGRESFLAEIVVRMS